ncbi:hypothetical protein Tco_1234690 [Tanacetum coccineum]
MRQTVVEEELGQNQKAPVVPEAPDAPDGVEEEVESSLHHDGLSPVVPFICLLRCSACPLSYSPPTHALDFHLHGPLVVCSSTPALKREATLISLLKLRWYGRVVFVVAAVVIVVVERPNER